MSVPGPGSVNVGQAVIISTLGLWPSSDSRGNLATTTVTTSVFTTLTAEELRDPSDSGCSQKRSLQATFLLLFAQAIPLVLLASTTVVCNLVVLYMFRVKRSLRSCKNMYLASLAMADLLIGGCMFVATVQQLRGQGPVLVSGALGAAYHVIRQAALYVSLLSLLLITVDRWWSIHQPFSYRAKRRKRNAAVAVGTVWLLGFAVHIVPVIVLEMLALENFPAVIETVQDSNATFPSNAKTGASSSLRGLATTVQTITANVSFFKNTILSVSSLSISSPSPFLSNYSGQPYSGTNQVLLQEPFKHPTLLTHVSPPPCKQNLHSDQRASHSPSHGLPLYEGLPPYNNPALLSLAWDIQYLVPLITMLTLNCSLYVGILGRKRVQIRRSLTSFNRQSSSQGDRRYSVSSMPNFYGEASSSVDENAELLLSSVKGGENDSGGCGETGSAGSGGTAKASVPKTTDSITNINTRLNFYSSSTAAYKQLQQHPHHHHHHCSRQDSTSTLRSSVSMPHVHISSTDKTTSVQDNVPACNGNSANQKTLTTVLHNNNNNNNNNNHSSVSTGLQPSATVVPPVRRFSWAPRKSSLALNRRSKGSEELAKDLLVRQDRKAACWLGLLVVVFLVCWLPHTILRVVSALHETEIPTWASDAAIWLQLANSTINPLLYGFFNKEIRQAFKQWVRGGSRRKRAKFNNALLLYGVNISSGTGGQNASARRMSLFDTVHE
ncbi:muscarinic acetylcholine receptor [Plakobranchus ocellatus]|uniref:Muscarinic acetylcholine receptor n=1 Tax=Plakobranchus ocellatus TaxID=259542 RepID=A0AAV3Y498_9GAST|nr:muscarinic acetylcholine receptor [Plakobranchus ocellatus]